MMSMAELARYGFGDTPLRDATDEELAVERARCRYAVSEWRRRVRRMTAANDDVTRGLAVIIRRTLAVHREFTRRGMPDEELRRKLESLLHTVESYITLH